jgi:hypothetical protein
VGGRAAQVDKEAASPSGVGRFETEISSQRHNLTTAPNDVKSPRDYRRLSLE